MCMSELNLPVMQPKATGCCAAHNTPDHQGSTQITPQNISKRRNTNPTTYDTATLRAARQHTMARPRTGKVRSIDAVVQSFVMECQAAAFHVDSYKDVITLLNL